MKKHIKTLCCVLVCYIASAAFLLAQAQETFTICPGDSIFLTAVQTFPSPPQGPAGPEGSIPITPCTPRLSSTSILPLTNIISADLVGFMVSPTTSTIYTVTSNGVCGGPGFGNTGEQVITYEVIVDACLPTVQETFTICAGESILLPAIQQFPQPPRGPQGAPTLCTPQLNETSISPTANANAEALTGFRVSPSTTTIYTVTSNGFCGAPGAGVNSGQINFVYEVIVETCAPTVQETFTICAGESILLPAIQQFPQPPQGPQGAPTPCTPQLNETSISPTANANAEALTGFRVSPSTTTIYTVTSNGFCGAPGIGANNDQINFVYEVIVEDVCGTTTTTDNTVFTNYPWLHTILDPTNCTGASVVVYLSGNTTYLLVTDGAGDQKLYLEEGSFYCQNADNYDCVALYGLTEIINSWDCGVEVEDCSKYTGVFFFEECAGETFYFIQLEDGRVFDPYFTNTTIFQPIEGQQATFNYEEADFITPCSIAEKAIIITCLIPIESPDIAIDLVETDTSIEAPETEVYLETTALLQEYSWLTDVLDLNNCGGSTVTIYEDGGYNYILVSNGTVSLYFQDGSLYCQNTATYDCISAYGLSTIVSSWVCSDEVVAPTDENDLFAAYDWLNNLVDVNNCSGTVIEMYELAGNTYLLIKSNGEERLYFKDGTFYCQTIPNYDCLAAYNLGTPTSSWTCSDNVVTPEPLPITSKKEYDTEPLTVFPNPTNGAFNVLLTVEAPNQQLRLYDLHGRILETRLVSIHDNLSKVAFDISNYPEGVYYLEWQSGKERSMQKVVKQVY